MASLSTQSVTAVHHWNDSLFSFSTTRDRSLRFENGHFVMLGLEVEGKPLMRAYSIASANYDEELEFLSIKVDDGPLTSRLQEIRVGDQVFVSNKPTGTLVIDHLRPAKNLYLLSTGTGLAPFISIIQDPEIYERFDKIILTHGVRTVSDLAYQEFITEQLPKNEFFGEQVAKQLLYYPSVTREDFKNRGRLTDLMLSGKLFADLKLDKPNPEDDRFMICGGPSMLKEACSILDDWGFDESRHGRQGSYVIERAFVE
ncbi:MAG: ferredoxin--NADP(+) reductase [SAR86 cluster bacterium]|uniref:ferredoxin--NADP(+) reductase n=1 Tax=SAR86 cluster bacterium TaxID=2030880 RepID=A0A2A4MTF0_9GAMM|nr:MAG: ferredoxin--NADP(+) reductase [SAR86 cluster bacterium]